VRLARRFTAECGAAFGGTARRGDGFEVFGLVALTRAGLAGAGLTRVDLTLADLTPAGLIRAGFLRTAGLARALDPAPGFCGGVGFDAGACMAARAALTFFLACLAAFLLALASFRARFSTALARRTCCFAVSARADACAASDWSRCVAAASFARFCCVEADVATLRSRLKEWRGR
jgi:hypothetical protein